MKFFPILSVFFGIFFSSYPKDLQPSSGLLQESFEYLSTVREINPGYTVRRDLPASHDLSIYMPPSGNQGQQASCSAWAVAYSVKSFYENRKRARDGWKLEIDRKPNYKAIFSPAFIYNQTNNGKDQGIRLSDALRLTVTKGSLPWDTMPYNEKNFSSQPSLSQLELAASFRAEDFRKLRYNNSSEIKTQIYQGNPVLAGILIDESFYKLRGKDIYKSHTGKNIIGHAIVITGYDDSLQAFKFQNSWGQEWGESGFGYIDYKWFSKIGRSAFVLYDNTENSKFSSQLLDLNLSPDPVFSERSPSDISASKGNFSDKVVITWAETKSAIGYEVFRSYPGENSYQQIGLSYTAYYEDTGIIQDVAFSYKIKSVYENSISELSESSDIGYAVKTAGITPPKISGLKVSKGVFPDKIYLEWQPLMNVTGYQVFKFDSRTRTFTSIGKTQIPSFTDRTASKNTVEIYTVAGLNNSITGELSDSASGYTRNPNLPSAPQNIKASLGEFPDKIEIRWDKVKDASGYFVYRFENGTWTPRQYVTEEHYTDTEAGKGSKYYAVTAKSSNDIWSNFSEYAAGYADPKNARTGPRLNPPRNVILSADRSSSEISIQWESAEKADEYNVWMKKYGDSEWKFTGKVSKEENSYRMKIPEKNEFYLFAVTSKSDQFQESDFSRPASFVESESKKAVLKRNFGSLSKAEKFSGYWSGMQWDGNLGVKMISMEITSVKDDLVSIKLDNKKAYEAKFVYESPVVEVEGKIRIKLSNDDALLVELKDKTLTKERVELSFLRD